MPDENFCDKRETIQSVITTVRDCAFQEDRVDFSLCYSRPENKAFIHANFLKRRDLRNILMNLRCEDYSHTSRENGKPDAYVFGVSINDDDKADAYLKLRIENGVLIISFHEPERDLTFPFRQ